MRRWFPIIVFGAALIAANAAGAQTPSASSLDEAAATRFAHLALGCLQKEYPNKIAHVMLNDADALPPRSLTPAFYGCYDWHSSVHGHWVLVRLLRLFPNATLARTRGPAVGELNRKNSQRIQYVRTARLVGGG